MVLDSQYFQVFADNYIMRKYSKKGKVLDEHRIVKIDYSVLKQFLDIIINADGTYSDVSGWDDYHRYDYKIDKKIKHKASNILDNS